MNTFFRFILSGLITCFWLVSNAQAIEISGGQSFIPGDYVSLCYESSPDYNLQWAFKGFYERAHLHSFKYSSFGIDALAVFPIDALRLAAGPTIQLENEPWVYRNWDLSRRLNFGITAQAALQWDVSQNISITATAQQKFLLNPSLGSTRFIVSIGLKYSFGN